jgi:hypothetical protein
MGQVGEILGQLGLSCTTEEVVGRRGENTYRYFVIDVLCNSGTIFHCRHLIKNHFRGKFL